MRRFIIIIPRLTDFYDGPEHWTIVVEGAAVPATGPELPLALGDTKLGPPTHVGHVVLVELTELGLARREATDLVADRLRSYDVQLRIPPALEALHPEVPAMKIKSTHRDSAGVRW